MTCFPSRVVSRTEWGSRGRRGEGRTGAFDVGAGGLVCPGKVGALAGVSAPSEICALSSAATSQQGKGGHGQKAKYSDEDGVSRDDEGGGGEGRTGAEGDVPGEEHRSRDDERDGHEDVDAPSVPEEVGANPGHPFPLISRRFIFGRERGREDGQVVAMATAMSPSA